MNEIMRGKHKNKSDGWPQGEGHSTFIAVVPLSPNSNYYYFIIILHLTKKYCTNIGFNHDLSKFEG